MSVEATEDREGCAVFLSYVRVYFADPAFIRSVLKSCPSVRQSSMLESVFWLLSVV